MIQGYAIYLRTHRKTGKQYAGAVWWSESVRTPEWATTRRWSTEDRKGIHGVFGGFDSSIVLSERREEAPEMSDGLYHIRIAVDEARIIEQIPEPIRLNKMSPLVQLHAGWRKEEMTRLAGRIGGRNSAQKAKANQTGVYSPTFDRYKAGQNALRINLASGQIQAWGAAAGRKAVESGQLARCRTPEHQRAASLARWAKV